MAEAKRSLAPRSKTYNTQRVLDNDKTRNEAMCKALNSKTRLEIALHKYLAAKGVPVVEIRAALESVKTAQQDEHFHLLWNLLDAEAMPNPDAGAAGRV